VSCSLLHIDALGKPRRLGLLGASVNKNKYLFLVDLVAHFLKLYVGCMRKWSVAMKIGLFAKTKVFMADCSFLRT
jgi:hypothetical protein